VNSEIALPCDRGASSRGDGEGVGIVAVVAFSASRG
jgi:hypothetical protein